MEGFIFIVLLFLGSIWFMLMSPSNPGYRYDKSKGDFDGIKGKMLNRVLKYHYYYYDGSLGFTTHQFQGPNYKVKTPKINVIMGGDYNSELLRVEVKPYRKPWMSYTIETFLQHHKKIIRGKDMKGVKNHLPKVKYHSYDNKIQSLYNYLRADGWEVGYFDGETLRLDHYSYSEYILFKGLTVKVGVRHFREVPIEFENLEEFDRNLRSIRVDNFSPEMKNFIRTRELSQKIRENLEKIN